MIKFMHFDHLTHSLWLFFLVLTSNALTDICNFVFLCRYERNFKKWDNLTGVRSKVSKARLEFIKLSYKFAF